MENGMHQKMNYWVHRCESNCSIDGKRWATRADGSVLMHITIHLFAAFFFDIWSCGITCIRCVSDKYICNYVKKYISNVHLNTYYFTKTRVRFRLTWIHKSQKKTGQEIETIIFFSPRFLWNLRINWIRFVMGAVAQSALAQHGSALVAPCTVS